MAQRRMISQKITNSARFLRMPIDSQNLYFHLNMHADDDGVVEAYSVLKMLGSAEDNLRVLATKNFVKVLNEDLVSYITDWNEHNKLRTDRITKSLYRPLLLQIVPDAELKEPKRRADLKPLEAGRPLDDQRTPQDRIGEDSIGKDRIYTEVLNYWNSKTIIVHQALSEEARREVSKIFSKTRDKWFEGEELEQRLDWLKRLVDVYVTVLEPEVHLLEKKKYWWSHKWNLYEFLKRGVKQFDGKKPEDYLKGRGETKKSLSF